MRLTDFKALTFDCYGTLIDWETGMLAALAPLAARAQRPLPREDILNAHARHESSQQAHTPGRRYSQLLAVVYKRLAEEWGTPVDWEECVAYGKVVRLWPPFPDTIEALRHLKRHFRLFILSNVDNETFAGTQRLLQVQFDGVMTAEDIGAYKPSARNFAYLQETLRGYGIAGGEVLHVAQSLYHDHRPANECGLASCWIDRRHAQEGFGATLDPGVVPRYDFRFRSMAELADAHRKELRD